MQSQLSLPHANLHTCPRTQRNLFFTVNLAERHGNDWLIQHIDALRDAFRVTKQAHPFVIEATALLGACD